MTPEQMTRTKARIREMLAGHELTMAQGKELATYFARDLMTRIRVFQHDKQDRDLMDAARYMEAMAQAKPMHTHPRISK